MCAIRFGMCAIAALMFALPCFAGPRTTVSYTNVDSIGTVGSPGNTIRTVTLTGGYPLKRIDFSGTLQTSIPNTAFTEARVKVTPPAGMGPVFTLLATFDSALQPAGSIFAGGSSVGAPPAGWTSSGTWTFEFYETFDDGLGSDAQWKNFNITFNNTPWAPQSLSSADDLGIISTGQRHVIASLPANTVKWYRFHLADSIGAVGHDNALSIDATGSLFSPITDTVLALYNSEGQRIARNDDISASNRFSALSFGTSIPAGSAVPPARTGADGSLDPSTYYLAVSTYAAANIYGDDFAATSAATTAGFVNITLRASVPGAAGSCPADFNRSGSIEVQDIFDYLSAWFAGCQ